VLHVRPLVNTKSQTDLDAMENIGEAVTDLVVEFGGSVSGEHGDGRARTQWNRKLYGERLWEAFRDLKTAFDPDWLLNPGRSVGTSPDREPAVRPRVRVRCRFRLAPEWDNENGMQGMVELCHGCGGCRTQQSEGGVMCPTFRAADEEVTSTRGRANMLRQAMSGDLPDDPTDDEFVTEVMDLCIGCKGCAHDCPSEVDMAKLKVEVEHAHHQEHGAGLRERVFANVDTLARVGSALAPLSNLGPKLPGARTVMEKTLGIARERSLPTFERESLQDWFEARGPQVPRERGRPEGGPVPRHLHELQPPRGREGRGPGPRSGGRPRRGGRRPTDSGRPSYSKGFVDATRETARDTVDALSPRVADGWDVVVVEPSDAVMLQSDYLDLLTGEDVSALAANSYGVCEYLDTFRLDDELPVDAPGRSWRTTVTVTRRRRRRTTTPSVSLRRAGYEVDPLDSGCCGMAGSFGYESEHHAMSMAIGETLGGQVTKVAREAVVAPGASCRPSLPTSQSTPMGPSPASTATNHRRR